jgi:hypothetical protein
VLDLDLLIPDARPSTLPDRAPRCLEDELLPDVQPLPPPKPSALGRWGETPQGREHKRAFDRKRARAKYARAEPVVVEHAEWCASCGVRRAYRHGRCARRCCRE